MQVAELIIFAVVAAVILYQLYAVLGRRVGRQPEESPDVARRTPALEAGGSALLPANSPALSGVAAIRAKDAGFDLDRFLAGAKSAFQTIVHAGLEGRGDLGA